MAKYQRKTKGQLEQLEVEGVKVTLLKIPREQNHEADIIAKLTILAIVEMLRNMLVETVTSPYTEHKVINVFKEKED